MKKRDKLIKIIGYRLEELKMTVVTAESCTGGYLAYCLSSFSESSSALERGYVTYSNQSKGDLLFVKPETLQLYGAVSKEVVLEMAEGALKNSKAQISISTTGIAGEDLAEGKKGTVWIAIVGTGMESIISKKEIMGTRKQFIDKTTLFAIQSFSSFLNKISKV